MADSGVFGKAVVITMEKNFVYGTLEGFDEEVGKHLYSLFVSICRVKDNYIHYTYHVPENANKDKIQKKRGKIEKSQVERVFAYELYHQWSNVIDNRLNANLLINSELPKNIISYDETEHLYYPDMILHLGQDKSKGNIIACEIKRKEYVEKNPKEMIEDLKKLRVLLDKESKALPYMEGWEPFTYGVLIEVVKAVECRSEDYSTDLIKKHLLNKRLGIPEEIMKRIICIVYNGYVIKYDTLYDLIKGN